MERGRAQQQQQQPKWPELPKNQQKKRKHTHTREFSPAAAEDSEKRSAEQLSSAQLHSARVQLLRPFLAGLCNQMQHAHTRRPRTQTDRDTRT